MRPLFKFVINIVYLAPICFGFFVRPALAGESANENNSNELSKSPDFQAFVQRFYGYLSVITIIAALLAIMTGAYIYMTSSGNPEKLGKAKEIITSAILALIVVALAYGFFRIIAPDIVGAPTQ